MYKKIIEMQMPSIYFTLDHRMWLWNFGGNSFYFYLSVEEF